VASSARRWWAEKVGRFVSYARARVSESERAELAALLTPTQRALFETMPLPDQRHGLDVAAALRRGGHGNDPELILAGHIHQSTVAERREFGTIDVMLSNAGIGDARGMNLELWDLSDDDWRDTIDVNLSSAFYCARAASKKMIDLNKPSGVIINVASGTALRAYTQHFAYGAAKAGVIALTKSLSAMLLRDRIRVNCIVPGFVAQRPPATDEIAAMLQARARYFPVQRIGEAWELGPLAVYLASEASSYVTGQSFVIDGGGLAGGVAPVGFAPEVG